MIVLENNLQPSKYEFIYIISLVNSLNSVNALMLRLG